MSLYEDHKVTVEHIKTLKTSMQANFMEPAVKVDRIALADLIISYEKLKIEYDQTSNSLNDELWRTK